ncbi:nuclear transport factor 2 family protein [Lentzea sp. NPDC051838]|uniref:nuclear transport factor 2 family protein n=1 Tax=Lentzea sp. NPDC051838 TaxID=3154849 RepID=UPI00342D0F9D
MNDRIEITELFSRLNLLLDDKRWDEVHTVFTTDISVYSPRNGEIHGLDDLVDFMCKAEVAEEHTQHVTTDVVVDVDGSRAAASANSVVHFFREGEAPHRTSGLRLDCTAVRTETGRRLSESRTTLRWTRKE